MTATRIEPVDRSLAIVKAAYRVMSSRGVHRVPLTDVAREAGVSKGLVLYHHRSKDALVLATLEWVLTATAVRLRRVMDAGSDPTESIRAVVNAVWRNPEANRNFFRFYLDGIEHQTRRGGFEGLGTAAENIIEGLYQEVLSSAMSLGVISPADPAEASATMRAIVEGYFLQWLQRTDWRATHSDYRQRCGDAVMNALSASC